MTTFILAPGWVIQGLFSLGFFLFFDEWIDTIYYTWNTKCKNKTKKNPNTTTKSFSQTAFFTWTSFTLTFLRTFLPLLHMSVYLSVSPPHFFPYSYLAHFLFLSASIRVVTTALLSFTLRLPWQLTREAHIAKTPHSFQHASYCCATARTELSVVAHCTRDGIREHDVVSITRIISTGAIRSTLTCGIMLVEE